MQTLKKAVAAFTNDLKEAISTGAIAKDRAIHSNRN